jgi:hypothetical protein
VPAELHANRMQSLINFALYVVRGLLCGGLVCTIGASIFVGYLSTSPVSNFKAIHPVGPRRTEGQT